jgi:hypothetical protein
MSTFLSRLAPAVGMLLIGQVLAQDGPVTGKEIQEAWSGKELIGTTASGSKVFMKLEADGKASVTAGSTNDIGTWRTVESGYCTTWQTIRAGQERCFAVTRSGSTFKITNSDGSLSGYFTSIK